MDPNHRLYIKDGEVWRSPCGFKLFKTALFISATRGRLPLTPAPCRYLLVRCDICLCGLCIVVRLNQLPVGHGWFALILFWLWIICYDGWTYLVTSCPDICQSRPSVNRNVEKNERKCPGGGFTQSHTSSDRGTSRAVCLHFQRFISNTME